MLGLAVMVRYHITGNSPHNGKISRYQQAVINSSENKLRLMDNLDKHQKDLATTLHLFMPIFYSLFKI